MTAANEPVSDPLGAVCQALARQAAAEVFAAYNEGIAAARLARRFTPAQQAVERLADLSLAAAGQAVSPDAIRRAIRRATNPDDLAERLATLYDQAMSTTEPSTFRETLERALFAADVMGYAHTETQD